MTRKNLLAGLGWIVLVILCWAPLFSVAKRTLPLIDPYAMGTVRYGLGVILFVMLLVAMEGRQALRYEGRFWAAAAFGLIGVTGFNLFIWIGLRYTQPEHASIINALQTPMTALIVWALRRQRPAGFTLACVALAIGGVILVVTGATGLSAMDASMLFGDFIVFLGAISWVIYTFAAAYFSGWSPLRISVLTCLPGLAGILLAHAAAVALGWATVPSAATLAELTWPILYLSVGSVVLGVLGFHNATRKLGPLNTILMLNSIPILVFAIETSLGRSFTLMQLAGAAVVVAALAANNLYLRGVSTRR